MEWLTSSWAWYLSLDVGEQTGVVGAAIAILAFMWSIYSHYTKRSSPASVSSQTIKNSTATASNGGTAVVAAGNVIFEQDPKLAEAFEILKQELEAKDRELARAQQKAEEAAYTGEQSLHVELAALKDAIAAIPKQTALPNAKAKIQEALDAAARGNTTAAEAIFSEVAEQKATEGKAANKEAAKALRHLGALAFLTDTQKAIDAYRRATELDLDNSDGWNQLGHLLNRTGKIDEALEAYRRVEGIGKLKGDNALLAVAYGNLGNLYRTRGELDQAEAMYKKSLALFEELGIKDKVELVKSSLSSLWE